MERLLSPPLIPGIAQYVHLLPHPSLIFRYLVIFDDEGSLPLHLFFSGRPPMLLITEAQSSLLAQKSTDGISLIRSSEYLFTRHPTTPIFFNLPSFLSCSRSSIAAMLSSVAGCMNPQVFTIPTSANPMSSTSTCPARSSSPARHSLSTLFFAHPRLRQYTFIYKGAVSLRLQAD